VRFPSSWLGFALHDMFALPFDKIAPIVGRSAAVAKQLASRARRRVHGAQHACCIQPALVGGAVGIVPAPTAGSSAS